MPKLEKFVTHYFTYYLEFPDGEYWVDQTPFVHDLAFQLQNTVWRDMPDVKRALMQKGEYHWKDQNSVTHRVVVEDVQRPRKWGAGKVRRAIRLVP